MPKELCRSGRPGIERFVAPAIAAFALCGCYPTLSTPFAEGTAVLAAGKVGLTVVGAGGYAQTDYKPVAPGTPTTLDTGGGGLEARVRVGVGAKQEIGASIVGAIGTGSAGAEPPFAVGGLVTYKVAPISWLALVADGGVLSAGASSIVTFGGDLAVILAPYTARDGSQLYTGARGGFSIPVLGGEQAHAVNESLAVPIGYALQLSEKTRLLFETGFVLGFTQRTNEIFNTTDTYTSYGGYGLFGFRYVFN